METTEKIVESYVRYIKGWATIPNIKCKGQLEIDLLAIDPVNGGRYHIESGVSISGGFSKLTGKIFDPDVLKERVNQPSQRRTVGYFRDKKFSSPSVLTKLAEYGFVNNNYNRIIVTWGWTEEAKSQADSASITLWHFKDLMIEIATYSSDNTYFTDDTLRTLQLLVKSLEEEEKSSNKLDS